MINPHYKSHQHVRRVDKTIYHQIPVEITDDDGNTLTTVQFMNDSEVQRRNRMVSEDHYKLKDLLSAGVPLKEIACSGLLDSFDFFDQEILNENISQDILDKLHDYDAKTSTDVKTSTESEASAVESDTVIES